MIAVTHLAVGAASGLMVQRCLSSDASNPEKLFLAFTVGFASHLVLDAFPHQEYSFGGSRLGLVLFVEITTIFVLLLSPESSLLTNAVVFCGMAGGALPDLIELIHRYVINWHWLDNLGSKIHFCHGAIPLGFEVNFPIQILIALVAVIIVKLKP